ncbi:MAG: YccF domain-containing protein [Pseudomonadota bacterium]|nr:YccF domain-containing protein [Pseudomonadota bacterium]
MTLLLNILWFIFGGFITGCLWLLGGAFLALTVVGLPWTLAAWRIAGFAFAPFGRQVEDRRLVTGREDLGTGGVGLILNIVWIVFGGWHIALAHILIGAAQAVTIIGIPFAIQNFKLAMIAIAPVGKVVVPGRLW